MSSSQMRQYINMLNESKIEFDPKSSYAHLEAQRVLDQRIKQGPVFWIDYMVNDYPSRMKTANMRIVAYDIDQIEKHSKLLS